MGWERFSGAFERLTESVWRTCAYGDFLSHLLVAEEPELKKWDMAANNIIVTEAGGLVTGFKGGRAFDELNALSTNGLLHKECLAIING